MYIIIAALCAAVLFVVFGMQPFWHIGKLPSGERLARIQASPNYSGGEFRYPLPTPTISKEDSEGGSLFKFFFGDKSGRSPQHPLPSIKTDLRALDPNQDLLVWLGHSSFYMQLGGFKILADPVLSPVASPFRFTTRAFPGTDVYRPEDLPDIDLLLISHDHWDHLDYRTVTALKTRVKKVLCPLGVGAHFEYWGFAPEQIIEGDWYDRFEPVPGLGAHLVPSRHFSGRFLTRNRSLWAGFVLETGAGESARRVFYSGDSGYGPHFAEIGERFGNFDLAIMEDGQYNLAWHYVHMLPEEVWRATRELGAGALLPVHAGKFSISLHDWQEPYRLLYQAAQNGGPGAPPLYTPIIGQPVLIGVIEQEFPRWWEEQ